MSESKKKVEHPVEYIKIKDLKLLEDNPRTISKKAFDRLKGKIERNPDFFEGRPCLLSNRTGEWVVFAGNQRLKAAEALGWKEVPCAKYAGLDEEREKELTIIDNVQEGDWDYDILANKFDIDLESLGVEILDGADFEEVVDVASDNTITEYSDNLDYDLEKLYREKCSKNITKEIDDGIIKGEIRPEIADILKTRASQCSIFNFDEIIKFYRSEDSSEIEKDLLRRLYLVFITPKEAVEKGVLEISTLTGQIYDNELTERADNE